MGQRVSVSAPATRIRVPAGRQEFEGGGRGGGGESVDVLVPWVHVSIPVLRGDSAFFGHLRMKNTGIVMVECEKNREDTCGAAKLF